MKSLNIGGKIISADCPVVMGVINITPDSFYKGSRVINRDDLERKLISMIEDGADIIDLGAFSSRPGAALISVNEELDRLAPAVEWVTSKFPEIIISVDSYKSEVLRQLIPLGNFIVNDISGFSLDPEILQLAMEYNLPYVLMHMQGIPSSMQDNPQYGDVVHEVLEFIALKLHHIKSLNHHQVIIDPGFGFGKSLKHNYQLLNSLTAFQIFECPIMVGLSRKSMIYKPLGITPELALNGTSAVHMLALQNGANMLRVHDVKEAKECIELWKIYKEAVK